MRASDLIKERNCPRTRAKECSCSKVNSLTESLDTVIAQCELQHSDTVKGTVLLMQAPGTPTLIQGTITGLMPGKHGFHIHEFGDIDISQLVNAYNASIILSGETPAGR